MSACFDFDHSFYQGVNIDGIPLVCGGIGYGGANKNLTLSDQCYQYNPGTNTWSNYANWNSEGRFAFASSVMPDNKWMVTGGKASKKSLVVLEATLSMEQEEPRDLMSKLKRLRGFPSLDSSFYLSDANSKKWLFGPKLPQKLAFHCQVCMDIS